MATASIELAVPAGPRRFDWLRRNHVDLFQGYYFAFPAFEALPDVAKSLFKV